MLSIFQGVLVGRHDVADWPRSVVGPSTAIRSSSTKRHAKAVQWHFGGRFAGTLKKDAPSLPFRKAERFQEIRSTSFTLVRLRLFAHLAFRSFPLGSPTRLQLRTATNHSASTSPRSPRESAHELRFSLVSPCRPTSTLAPPRPPRGRRSKHWSTTLDGHSTTIAPEFEGRTCLGCRLLVAGPPVRSDPVSFQKKGPAPKPMVRLIRPTKDPVQERDERVWEFLPSALWDLNFRGPLEWMEEQGCRDADAFKQLVRNNPDALGECLERIRIHRVSAGAVALVGASSEEECIRRSRELLTAESKADFLRILMAAFRNEHDVHLETAMMTCSREPRDVRAHWRFVEDENGRFGRALVSVTT